MTSFAAGEYQLLLLSLGAVRRRGPGGRSVRRARATCSPQYNRPPYDDIRSRRLAVGPLAMAVDAAAAAAWRRRSPRRRSLTRSPAQPSPHRASKPAQTTSRQAGWPGGRWRQHGG